MQAIRISLATVAAVCLLASTAARSLEREPIAYVGHGAFFDAEGKQVAPTPDFVARAQAFYRAQLSAALSKDGKAKFAAFQRKLAALGDAGGQSRLVIDQRALDWLAANVDAGTVDARVQGKISALRYALEFRLAESSDPASYQERKEFPLDPALRDKLDSPELKPNAGGGLHVLTATLN